MFQPVPEPVASPTSSAWVVLAVWSRPFNVAEKVTLGGVDTKPSEPAAIVAVPVAPSATTGSRAATSSTASPAASRRPVLVQLKVIEAPFLVPRDVSPASLNRGGQLPLSGHSSEAEAAVFSRFRVIWPELRRGSVDSSRRRNRGVYRESGRRISRLRESSRYQRT